MIVVAGIDVGTRMTKACIVDGEAASVSVGIVLTGVDLAGAAQQALQKAIERSGRRREQVSYIACTGYGRYLVPFRDVQITEMTCHAYGAKKKFPKTRCVLDIGAQNSRAMRVAGNGRVERFRVNDKCASGAGRFLERVATALEVDLDQIGELSLRATDPQPISSICAVLAESEVINQITQGNKVEDILCGVHQSLAERIVALVRQIGVEPEVTLTGGVTKNPGMVQAIEKRLGVPVNSCPESEFLGAYGAAGLAFNRVAKPQTEGQNGQIPQLVAEP